MNIAWSRDVDEILGTHRRWTLKGSVNVQGHLPDRSLWQGQRVASMMVPNSIGPWNLIPLALASENL
jgi:hypothetical protein